jgi:DNA-binding Xre family transcriptional regulator
MNLELALKYLLRGKDITMTDVIKSVGMSQAGFYKMLNSNSVKVNTLEKIAQFLNVDVSLFFRDYSSIHLIESMDWATIQKHTEEARKDWPKQAEKPKSTRRKTSKDEEKFSNLLLVSNIYNYHLKVFHADVCYMLEVINDETTKEDIIEALKAGTESLNSDWLELLDVVKKL